jgi:3-hydroxyisobutyrate dehydrogenase-like beta-hydroxyacid dehydrogenase
MADVAVLGTGRMGAAMVRRLVAAGHDVVVWNRTRESAEAVARDGSRRLRVADSAAGAVREADFVLCALANGDVTCATVLHPDLLTALRPDARLCDMGTSGVEAAQSLAAGLGERDQAFIDAPVSGSVSTVDAGQVLVMAGGRESDIEAVSPVLESFAKSVVRVGMAGAGQAMKLAVNLVVHDLNAALSEAMVLATRAGIDPTAAYDVFAKSVVAAPYVVYKRDAFLTTEAPVAMSLDLVEKDLRLINALADSLGVQASATRAVAAVVSASCRAGFGSQDMASLARFLEQSALPATTQHDRNATGQGLDR